MRMRREKLSAMCLGKSKEKKVRKPVIYILIIIGAIMFGGVCGAGIYRVLNETLVEQLKNESLNLEEQISSEIEITEEKDINTEAGNIPETESNLNEILAKIHKQYIYSQWFLEDKYGIPNNYLEDRIVLQAEDLEEVIFYKNNDGMIYFIPTSMVNVTVQLDGKEIQVCEYYDEGIRKLYLYSYELDEPKLERAIYPEVDMSVRIYSEEVQDFLDDLHLLGTASVPFPEKVPDGAAKLYENEYTSAVIDIIHSLFWEMERYGEYQVYFGEYIYDSKMKYEYKFYITVAIVGEETSYWWIFRAKDKLSEDGRGILDSDGGSNHSFPAEYDKDNYNYYAPWIDGIIHANRLVVPLTITESDIIKELGAFKDEDDLNTIHFYLK